MSRRPRTALLRQEGRDAYIFLAPWLLGFLIFTAGPTVASVVLIFMNWEIISPPTFAGLANVRHLVADPLFYVALGNTLYYVFLTTTRTAGYDGGSVSSHGAVT